MDIREATGADASNLVAYLKTLVSEPATDIPLTADEVPSVEQERHLLDEFAKSERALMLIALDDGKLVGELSIKAISSRKAIRHVATLGMSVASSHRRKGVGRALLEAAIEWAPTAGIRRIELYVYARNEAAIKLYETMGFNHEGRRRGFIREGNAYLDDLVMGRFIAERSGAV
jgi:putative acetyltransferase